MTTGEKISKLRKEMNLTQEQFASAMEVSRQSVSKWEQDVTYPETEKIIKMSAMFHCSIDYLLREEITNRNSIGDIRNFVGADHFHKNWKNERIPKVEKKTTAVCFEGKQPLMQLSGIAKFFPKSDKIETVFQNVNLSFYKGEFVAITGESGCGKTTLINIINGSLIYDNGEIYYKGKKYSDFDSDEWNHYATEEVGYIAQDNKLLSQYTVEQNILSVLYIKQVSIEDAYKKVDKILECVGLEEHKKQKIVELSAGQRQRVAIARMLAKDAKIILADEPTANLDEETSKSIYEIFRNISKDRLVIMITHSYKQTLSYITRHVELGNRTVSVDEVLVNSLSDEETVPDELIPEIIPDEIIPEIIPNEITPEELTTIEKGKNDFTKIFARWNLINREKISACMILILLFAAVPYLTI